jgi:hypothetical protein
MRIIVTVIALFIFIVSTSFISSSSGLPSTEIWLFDFKVK